MTRTTVRDIQQMKAKGEKIPMVTAYDYTMARLADEAGIPILLVGDSLGMVVLGYESTIPVTMEDMVRHTRAVARGCKRALVVGDMPFMSYQEDASQALRNAARLVQEGGAQAVKLEGGVPVADTVRRIAQAGVPVMGHIGLTPQSVNQFGGFRVQGRTRREAEQLIRDAQALEVAGAFAIVLELVPISLAQLISEVVTVPTIGIGSGPHCDGQVQVLHDMLGLYTDFVPRHTKQYAKLGEQISAAFAQYATEVQSGAFPTEKHAFTADEAMMDEIRDLYRPGGRQA